MTTSTTYIDKEIKWLMGSEAIDYKNFQVAERNVDDSGLILS